MAFNGDSNLVASLVDRLATRLPHRTGSTSYDLSHDELVTLTRATLIDISNVYIESVFDALLLLLEDLSGQYRSVSAHPVHVIHSELYILCLLADCCTAHWDSLKSLETKNTVDIRHASRPPSSGSDAAYKGVSYHNVRNNAHEVSQGFGLRNFSSVPSPLDEALVVRILAAIKRFLAPVTEQYVLPASSILRNGTLVSHAMDAEAYSDSTNSIYTSLGVTDTAGLMEKRSPEIELRTRTIIEFVSASNWQPVFDHLKATIRNLRSAHSVQSVGNGLKDDDRSPLISLRLIAFLWVDTEKLSLVISELCGNFLHLKKSFQNTVAIVLPLLISRWLEQNSDEFVAMHITHTRLDCGADILFDMMNQIPDAARLRATIWPFQVALLFLCPDVFQCATFDSAKGSNMIKKVAFLDSLRKALRNRNASAAYCLISVLRVARHFNADSDAALLSYALDVQDEVREAVFRRFAPGIDTTTFEDSLISAAFVSLAHLNFDSCNENIAPLCLTPRAPLDFKLAFLSACCYFAGQPNADHFQPFFAQASRFIRSHLKLQLTAREYSEFEERGKPTNLMVISSSPKLILRILAFLDISPLALFDGAPADPIHYDQFFQENFAAFAAGLVADDERIRSHTGTVARKLMADSSIFLLHKSIVSRSDSFYSNFWRSTSVILLTVSDKLVNFSDHGRSMLTFVHDFLESRVKVLKSVQEISDLNVEVPERIAAYVKLETVFLVLLCSADIETCQLVTACIALLCEESQMVGVAFGATKFTPIILKNVDIYRELSSRDFRFTGLVAFQKRLRSLLRRMRHPSTSILNAWEVVFGRWYDLSKRISTSSSGEQLDDQSLIEWRNCSGFLAALAGCCISEKASANEESVLAGLKWIDQLSQDSYDETLLDRYMMQSVQLLACNNVRIREATKEVLSSETSPALLLPLFKTLESELEGLFDGSTGSSSQVPDANIYFAEQAAALLRTIVEKLGGSQDTSSALSIDAGALTLSFAKFLNTLPDSGHAVRIKIKVCQLCEVVTRKKELLNLRHDVRIRNQLLEVMFGWIARPGSPRFDTISLPDGRQVDEALKLQKDLDRACLKALSDLTYRLPLQPPEGQSDADTSDSKSQMFHQYFNRFLSLLNVETVGIGRSDSGLISTSHDPTPCPELAIVALSNLLSANLDVGLKHSLGIGYHEDIEIRTAFVKVLCNVLAQGTEFNNISHAAVNQRYEELVELLVNDLSLTTSLCDACPSSEVDELTISLLNIFDSRGLGFVLLQALIEHEVEETENEAELLRRNCVTTKMLSVYAKWKGSSYLKATLQNVLERLIVTSKDLNLELDPARTSSPEELQKNALQLRVVTQVFIDDICNSAAHTPISFRRICSIISSSVMTRFPEAKFTAVGAFVFLRFFCPAIVAPDAEGLISTTPSKEMRRGLLLIAKIVQNLANNVLFGAKESYMFPLNDFLTQNIYRVTAFLREISVPPVSEELPDEAESFEFGSSVALHRFFYDHWDHVRPKLVVQARKVPLETATGRSPIVEVLRNLIANLGPPPMDISWNRPMISMNSPPSYSRFQHFMLSNAGRSMESAVSTRAVYDGGESKDGLSMICIILRNIDTETSDYDLLLYCYLKIASRMWHRPFGILIDATCYSGQNEPQDAIFRRLDLLTPTELSKKLSRIYVYNMNSAFRKCFRRILRLSTKSENSAFHPRSVDYHLIGSLQDLESHFHLSQLHLPKETISVVSDTRYVFQPITRLSKTKGKVEVIIRIGSQFVQVTTTKKQEVIPGLRLHATVNDIFRLSEVDEAPTSIQTEDDSAFGLRTEGGKIVMYFTSPKKPDILQAIRGAKSKYGKNSKGSLPFERLIRPQDVPGTLLNIAFTNMAIGDQSLRLSSYNLLCALCQTFKFKIDSKFMTSKDLWISPNASHFVVEVSKQLAHCEPQLTADFLNEFFVGWDSFPLHQRPLSLAYMAPWLPGLRTYVLSTDIDGEKARDKIATIFRKLIDVALSDASLSITLEQIVWPTICQDEIQTEILLEEIVKAALGFGVDDDRTQVLGSVVVALRTVSVRGKLLSKLRKALNRTSLRPTRYLPENVVWDEICVLLQLCLSMSFDGGVQPQLFLPELFHIVTMLANTGSSDIRLAVHRLLVNTIHALGTNLDLEENKVVRLRAILTSLVEGEAEIANSKGGSWNSTFSPHPNDIAGFSLLSTEAMAIRLSEVSIIAAPSIDLSNAWRSRWMSLVASTAFQSNPAVQPRAFTVMGCLAREDVDDDLLYQVLVALRSSINRFAGGNENEMIVAIVTSLTKMMEKLPVASRYGLQLFWLALALVRLVPLGLFNCTAAFLEAVLVNINTSGELKDGRMVPVILQGRLLVETPASMLDESYGIHFNVENFHFAVCASLVKGLTDPNTKMTTIKVLSTFLDIASANTSAGRKFPDDLGCLPYLGMVMSRVACEEAKQNSWLAGVTSINNNTPQDILAMIDLNSIKDKELLLTAAIGIVDFQYLEDRVQNSSLLWLNKVAILRPTVILHLCDPVFGILNDILISCQNVTTLESAHLLLRTLTSNPKLLGTIDTAQLLEEVLEDIGFGGLWSSSTFHASSNDKQRTALTDRLVELIIA